MDSSSSTEPEILSSALHPLEKAISYWGKVKEVIDSENENIRAASYEIYEGKCNNL